MLRITKWNNHYQKEGFDCGVSELNYFLHHQVSQYMRRQESILYCAIEETSQKIIGFYTLSNLHIYHHDNPTLLKRQHPYLPIPCALIGRLAVDKNYQGKGLGADLLLHALKNIKQLSHQIGIAFAIVEAKNQSAKEFYEHYGFQVLQQTENCFRLAYPTKHIPHK